MFSLVIPFSNTWYADIKQLGLRIRFLDTLLLKSLWDRHQLPALILNATFRIRLILLHWSVYLPL